MKSTIKRLWSTVLIVLLALLLALPSVAAKTQGSITVRPEGSEKQPLDGITIQLCQVAKLDDTGYHPTNGFENSGISIDALINAPTEENAAQIARYAKQLALPTLSAATTRGQAVFTAPGDGIWVVFVKEDAEYRFNPFLVFLPQTLGDQVICDVLSTPKTEIDRPENKSIYVLKKWNDKNNAAKKRPDRITAELRRDGEIVDVATLSENTGWAHTFTDLPKDGVYTVTETAVANYTPQYSGDSESGFIITNAYSGEKLPQTGQLWWPIAVLGVAGVGFVLLGILDVRRKANETT